MVGLIRLKEVDSDWPAPQIRHLQAGCVGFLVGQN